MLTRLKFFTCKKTKDVLFLIKVHSTRLQKLLNHLENNNKTMRFSEFTVARMVTNTTNLEKSIVRLW